MKNGNMNARELATLHKALDLLSDWLDWAEENGEEEGYAYDNAGAAVAGLCEYLCEADPTDWR